MSTSFSPDLSYQQRYDELAVEFRYWSRQPRTDENRLYNLVKLRRLMRKLDGELFLKEHEQ
jgi:hypothetical protein